MTTKLDMFRNSSNTVHFAAGETIFNADDEFDTAYVVQNGEVSIIMDGAELCVLGEGELFGEMALINGNKRSADAIALTDVDLARISPNQFNFLVDNNRLFAQKVMQVLSERLLKSHQSNKQSDQA